MGRLIWSPSALDDIESIADFIARDSVDRAALFVQRLIERAEELPENPASGRVIPEIGNENYREVIVYPYRIMYRLEGGDIWITGVIHGARDWHL